MDLVKIGKYIAGKRKDLGMTQKQLAEKLGMSDKSVSKWERAEGMPDVYVLTRIASLYGVSVNELLCEGAPVRKPLGRVLVALLSAGQEDLHPRHAKISLWQREDKLFDHYEIDSPILLREGSLDFTFLVVVLMPSERQAISSSRSASQARPMGRRRRRMVT